MPFERKWVVIDRYLVIKNIIHSTISICRFPFLPFSSFRLLFFLAYSLCLRVGCGRIGKKIFSWVEIGKRNPFFTSVSFSLPQPVICARPSFLAFLNSFLDTFFGSWKLANNCNKYKFSSLESHKAARKNIIYHLSALWQRREGKRYFNKNLFAREI